MTMAGVANRATIENGEAAILTSRLSECARHIGSLFGEGDLADDEWIEIRAFRGPKVERRFVQHTASAVSAALDLSAKAYDVYVGVAARRCPDNLGLNRCTHAGKGGKSHIARVGWAFCEIDAGKGEYDDTDAILRRLDALILPPHLVVTSGGGAHAYWHLEQPTSDFGRFERLTRALQKELGHDPAIDVSRVLRVAGTMNHKYTPAPLARVARWRPPDA